MRLRRSALVTVILAALIALVADRVRAAPVLEWDAEDCVWRLTKQPASRALSARTVAKKPPLRARVVRKAPILTTVEWESDCVDEEQMRPLVPGVDRRPLVEFTPAPAPEDEPPKAVLVPPIAVEWTPEGEPDPAGPAPAFFWPPLARPPIVFVVVPPPAPAIPEPDTVAAYGAGLALLGWLCRRRFR